MGFVGLLSGLLFGRRTVHFRLSDQRQEQEFIRDVWLSGCLTLNPKLLNPKLLNPKLLNS